MLNRLYLFRREWIMKIQLVQFTLLKFELSVSKCVWLYSIIWLYSIVWLYSQPHACGIDLQLCMISGYCCQIALLFPFDLNCFQQLFEQFVIIPFFFLQQHWRYKIVMINCRISWWHNGWWYKLFGFKIQIISNWLAGNAQTLQVL